MLFPKRTICMIDTSWLLYRSLYSRQSGQVSSFVGNVYAGPAFVLYQSILAITRRFENIVFVIDGWPAAKHEMFPDYKAQRVVARSEDPNYQMNRGIRAQLRNWIVQSIPSVLAFLPHEEADDCIGSLAHQLSAKGVEVHVLCSDKDLWQLMSDKVHLWKIDDGFNEVTLKDVDDAFGVAPDKIPLYKAWFGDSSDNIPKLFRMPSKYAMPMIKACSDVDECIKRLPEFVDKADWIPKFQGFEKQAKINLELATIKRNLQVPFAYFKPDPEPLQGILNAYRVTSFTAQNLFEAMTQSQNGALRVLFDAQLLNQQNTIPFEALIKEVG